ncbi:MAG: hypothetical protein O7G85_11480, partial [Planctomycetota bacterium]|nr:hypothetical protein [Planctomycetota bacterium]
MNRHLISIVAGLSFAMPLNGYAQTSQPTSRPDSQPMASANPAAEGFDHEGSDEKAIAIADSVMEKMGGRQAWDDTRFISWKFFDFRMHVWDKHTGDVRIEFTNREGVHHLVLSNIHSGEGKAFVGGEPVTDEEELENLMTNAKSWWINDSYWLVVPYKLKDSGVTLTYVGEADMEDGRASDVLQLVFKGVGNTPENKYHVFVAKDSGLVEQWSFFRTVADEEPAFKSAWHNWQPHGAILLSDDRGVMRGNPTKHTGVAVFESLPRSVFESADPFIPSDHQTAGETSMNSPLDKLAPLLGDWTGTLTSHGEDESVVGSFAIRWHSAPVFEGRHLRFEISSIEPLGNGYYEFEGLFTIAPDGETLETVWMNPLIRRQTDRFLNSQVLFCEKGTWDSSGTILRLMSDHQYGPDQPVIRIESVF